MDFIFRKAAVGEDAAVYAMVADRVRWMDWKGLKQWNTTDYLTQYPPEYFLRNLDRLFVLCDKVSGRILSAAVLPEHDSRWADREPALYIHNFVSVPGVTGAGKVFIRMAEEYAIQQGKLWLRLDSPRDNMPLAEYYDSLGFTACGFCSDGPYHGILRQKNLKGKASYAGI